MVEDDPRIRGQHKEWLEQDGYQVVAVVNGVQALKVLQKSRFPFAVVVTDNKMPRMGGEELAEKIKELFPKIPIIMFAGTNPDELSAHLFKAFIPKATEGNMNKLSAEVSKLAPINDKAMLNPNDLGGIDFNPKLFDLEIKRDGKGVALPVDQQPLGEIHIDGFIPVIINITPIQNLPLLLGFVDANVP